MPPFVQGFNPPNASISGNPVYVGGRDVNQSIVGLQLDSTGNINVGGSVLAFQGGIQITSIAGTPNVNTAGSVVAFQGAGWSGSVAAVQAGTRITSLISTVPSSVIVGTSIFGQLPAGTAMVGSVVAYQGVTPWIETFSNSSILAVPVGSTIAILQSSSLFSAQQGTWRVSVAGGYTAGQASVVSAVGLLNLAVRNDTMASTLSADAQYSPLVVGPVGEIITANAPITKWISGTQSVLGPGQFGPSVIVLAAAGAGKFNYVTGLQIANFSAPSVLVTLYSATDSILGRLVAPSGGTMVQIYYSNPLKTLANTGFTASVFGTNSSIFLSAQGFTSTT